jgi:hypothetical protein
VTVLARGGRTCAIVCVLGSVASCDFDRVFNDCVDAGRCSDLDGGDAGLSCDGGVLSLSVVGIDGASGAILAVDGGLLCASGTCLACPGATPMSLFEAPSSPFGFQQWGGDCADAGQASACVLDGGGHSTVSAFFSPFNVVFVTRAQIAPWQLGGLAAADAICADAGLSGHFVAWLSSHDAGIDASSRLGGLRGWVRTDGRPFVDTLGVLLNGNILYPATLDELGDVVSGRVMTGTVPNGSASQTCGDWTDDAGVETFGESDCGAEQWTAYESKNAQGACASPQHLYCFQIDYQTVVPPFSAPSAGRMAFLSMPVRLSDAGSIKSLDQECQNEANATLGTGKTFSAFAAMANGATAASRFQSDGGAWFRLDGIPLAASADDWLNGTSLLAPLEVTVNGQHVNSDVWTGAASPSSTPSSSTDCTGWVYDAGTVIVGDSTSLIRGFDSGIAGGCADSDRLYCLEQ